jgi:hypothetical protein
MNMRRRHLKRRSRQLPPTPVTQKCGATLLAVVLVNNDAASDNGELMALESPLTGAGVPCAW